MAIDLIQYYVRSLWLIPSQQFQAVQRTGQTPEIVGSRKTCFKIHDAQPAQTTIQRAGKQKEEEIRNSTDHRVLHRVNSCKRPSGIPRLSRKGCMHVAHPFNPFWTPPHHQSARTTPVYTPSPHTRVLLLYIPCGLLSHGIIIQYHDALLT
jgi:hypothetical protein